MHSVATRPTATHGIATDLRATLPAFEYRPLGQGTWIAVDSLSLDVHRHVFPVHADRHDGIIVMDGDRAITLKRGEYVLVIPGLTPVDWS
ncbi:hypothetical protein [Streptomyces albidoflavus]|uniref:hypothetical protein n=1 Tax=Streptomyces albidoflavus TaxID=1886 RepID=UPI0010201FD1|nr:hypothetical protein [Streptomyces albidoflavus]RZF02910.1 hypothetical protein C0R05_32380 [Streptomyces albidoflavus]